MHISMALHIYFNQINSVSISKPILQYLITSTLKWVLLMSPLANMEAFNEMLGNRNVCVRHDPR